MAKEICEVTGIWIRNLGGGRPTELLLEIGGSWKRVKKYAPDQMSHIIEMCESNFEKDDVTEKRPGMGNG